MDILLSGIKVNELLERIGQLIDAKIGIQPTKTKEQSNYLSRKEVAQLLKISLPTLHDWTKLGYLNAYKIGSRVLYNQSEIKAAVEVLPSIKHKKGGMSHA